MAGGFKVINNNKFRGPLFGFPGLELIINEDGDLIIQEEEEDTDDQCGQDQEDE